MGCLVFDPATVVADEPLGPSQYRFVGTWAWWMASGGPALRRYCYLAENVIRVWVPADQRREWLLDRTLTGQRIWLAGSEEDLAAAGSEIPQAWPTGRWRAPYGDFFASDDGREPGLTDGGGSTLPRSFSLLCHVIPACFMSGCGRIARVRGPVIAVCLLMPAMCFGLGLSRQICGGLFTRRC